MILTVDTTYVFDKKMQKISQDFFYFSSNECEFRLLLLSFANTSIKIHWLYYNNSIRINFNNNIFKENNL